jgi:hypothetical protein
MFTDAAILLRTSFDGAILPTAVLPSGAVMRSISTQNGPSVVRVVDATLSLVDLSYISPRFFCSNS